MRIAFEICGRGRTLAVHEHDWASFRLIYFSYAKIRRGVMVRHFAVQDRQDGGVEVSILRDGKRQGWFLRGPVGHFEWP